MRMASRHAVWMVVIALALTFLFFRSGFDFDYVIPKRFARLAAMLIGGVCIAWSSIVFQTITGNRILTPAIMGYEAVYLLLQSLAVLLMGTQSLVVLGANGNFFLSVLLMLCYSWAIHRWLFRDGRNNVYFLLLLGLVLTMVIGTFTQFVQLKVSPGEFSVLLGFSQASFGKAEPGPVARFGHSRRGGVCRSTQDPADAGRAFAGSRPGCLPGRGLPAHRAAVSRADRRTGRHFDQPARAYRVHGHLRGQHHLCTGPQLQASDHLAHGLRYRHRHLHPGPARGRTRLQLPNHRRHSGQPGMWRLVPRADGTHAGTA